MIKKLIKYLFFFLVLILLGFASIFGVVIPDNSPVKTIGSMQISAFKNGISLYQGTRPYFYTFSPYNDYFSDISGNRNTFILQDEIKEDSFTTDLRNSRLKDIKNTILSYFNIVDPHITYHGIDKEFGYYSKTLNNQLSISYILKTNNNSSRIVGLTLPYYGMDFIYDKSGDLYVYKSDWEIANFSNFYGIKLTEKLNEFRIQIPYKKIIIANPYLSSVIMIEAGSQQNIWINRNTKMIEVEEQTNPQNGFTTATMRIAIYDNPKEAQKYL